MFGGTVGADDKPGRTWFAPGGGVRPGESLTRAAVRELAGEAGLLIRAEQLGPVVAVSAGIWWAGPRPFFGVDSYFLIRATQNDLDVDAARHEEHERAALATHRWWAAAELDKTSDRVFPHGAADLLRTILSGHLSGPPIRVRWREHRTHERV